MELVSLSVNKAIEFVFSDDRKEKETITEAKVILMRDGKDLESELTARQKKPEDLTFTLSRTPLGDVEVLVSKVAPTRG